ncbi:mitogen-activated protein kinase kinase kinase 19 [Silurus meridionalis]|nr:mitogen-activated protein kinase kinase kinase 19 [Silurus meridionalis]
MDINKATEFALLFLLLWTLFTVASGNSVHSHCPIVYTMDQLLAFRNMPMLLGEKTDIPHELRRRRQGNRAGAMCRNKWRRYRPTLPFIVMGNPGGLSSSFQSHRGPNHSMQLLQLKTDEHINERHELFSSETEDSDAVQLSSQPLINTWTGNRTKSPVYRFFDEVGEGPVTDDLLRRLAEELISLEEKEGEPKNPEWTNDPPEKFKVTPLNNLLRTEKSSVDDTITWTKGEILGRGAYGTVYCGLSSEGQLIAVKQVTLDVSNSETAEKEYDRLEREVDLLKNLNHQNIVGFLGTTLSGNVISILMEYVPGGSISNVLNRFGPLPEKVFALYTRQILEGVVYLHDNRVIHRDLKGNNIMLMPSGIIKLIDFGCARRLNCLTHSGSRSDFLTSVHGTPYWMAPEVINESGHGKKSDIWSIGCTVFEMATGKPPLAHMGKMA